MPILAQQGRAGHGEATRAQRGAPGLVSLSTSPTAKASRTTEPRPEVVPLPVVGLQFTPQEARLKRMKEGIQAGVRLAEANLERPGFRAPVAWMLTLTYAQPDAWEPRHVSACIDRLTKWAARQGHDCGGAWCAEMQDRRYKVRGELAIHYHVIVWLPRGVMPPKPDVQGWWAWGMTKRERVRLSANAYISKYASKGTEAPLPKGARIYGVYGLGNERARYTWLRRPLWLRERSEVGESIRRRQGGGWINIETGEVHESPWYVSYSNGIVHCRLKEEPCRSHTLQ